ATSWRRSTTPTSCSSPTSTPPASPASTPCRERRSSRLSVVAVTSTCATSPPATASPRRCAPSPLPAISCSRSARATSTAVRTTSWSCCAPERPSPFTDHGDPGSARDGPLAPARRTDPGGRAARAAHFPPHRRAGRPARPSRFARRAGRGAARREGARRARDPPRRRLEPAGGGRRGPGDRGEAGGGRRAPLLGGGGGGVRGAGGCEVRAGAAVRFGRLARAAVARGLSGLEYAEGIPGTVGGALFMNAGAYGGEVAAAVTAVDGVTSEGELLALAGDALAFRY